MADLAVAAARGEHAVGEWHLQIAVQPVMDAGGLDTAPPVLVLRIEDAQVDERGQLRRIAQDGNISSSRAGADGPSTSSFSVPPVSPGAGV
ncbi:MULTISPECIES: hypothetical protein [unclassified Streptomyces]|uniref:hypothetical protein n=1 Tax=unclassified Streptomyces TaxID=2593676 RepID=UPI00136E02C3|nr:hypothetical protein [Streptomyces sp. KhCrAH-43]MYS33701.1 hypothetical protein [Streptomyces sp. SID4920]MYX67424.1 hypothetical protein [Streptomyces sp. SID8373]